MKPQPQPGRRDAGGTISSSSLRDLKAELARKKSQQSGRLDAPDDAKKRRKVEDGDYTVKTSSLKGSVFPKSVSTKHSKSTSAPSSSNGGHSTLSTWSSTPSARLERDRNAALERKARMYDQLQRGMSAGFRPEDMQDGGKLEGLVDWARKREERGSSDDSDESSKDADEDEGRPAEDLVEYVDDLGRTRTVPRSQVPMEYLEMLRDRETNHQDQQNDHLTIHGRQTHFPVLAPHTASTSAPPTSTHFNSSFEIRNRGAGFYRFESQDEQVRKRQMEELKGERERTERARQRQGDQKEEDPGLGPEQRVGERREQDRSPYEERLARRRAFVEGKRKELAAERRRRDGDSSAKTDEGHAAAVDVFLQSLQRDLAAKRQP